MNKYLLLATFITTCNVSAQNIYYYAPIIQLSSLDTPIDKVGHDFGYLPNSNNLTKGYYIWLDEQWYSITNAKELFQTTENGLAFYIDRSTKKDLLIKDPHDFQYSYPIEAIDRYITSEAQYNQLAVVTIETNNAKSTISEVENTTIEEIETSSPLLDVIDIKEEIVQKVIPYKESTEKNTLEGIEKTETPIEIIEDKKDAIYSYQYIQENPYEVAVKNGFEGSVTEWIEYVTEKEKKSPYEIALENGYDRSETDFMRLLWGSKVNPEIDKKERDTQYVLDWIDKIKLSDGDTPYELALRHGFYGTFTEWVESVIGKDGEAIYNDDVKKGFKGSYRSWVENKLKLSNDEFARKELLKKQNFIMVPNLSLSVPNNPEEVATFSLYNYYQMYYGNSVISSSNSSKTISIKPEEIEYQITWFNQNEIKINSISIDGIIYYQKNPSYQGNATNLNVRYIIK